MDKGLDIVFFVRYNIFIIRDRSEVRDLALIRPMMAFDPPRSYFSKYHLTQPSNSVTITPSNQLTLSGEANDLSVKVTFGLVGTSYKVRL